MDEKTMSHFASSADYHKNRYRDLRAELDKRSKKIEELQSQLEKYDKERIKLKNLLHEAGLQIEYLQNKFGQTGSGNNVLSRIHAETSSIWEVVSKSDIKIEHDADGNFNGLSGVFDQEKPAGHAHLKSAAGDPWGVPAGSGVPIRTGKYTSSISDDIILPHRLMEYVIEWSIGNSHTHIKERFGKQFIHQLNREEFYNLFHTIISEDSLLLLKKDENDA